MAGQGLPDDRLAALFQRHRLILFDAVCPLCAGFAGLVVRWDREARYRFVSVQSDLGQAILARFGLPLVDWESNVLIADGRPSFKSEAFFGIMRGLPAPLCWAGLADVVPRVVADWIYDRIAGNRYGLFGRFDRCQLPESDGPARFLG